MSYCENCGKQVSAKANFCGHCGQRIVPGLKENKENFDRGSVSPSPKEIKRQNGKPPIDENASGIAVVKNAKGIALWMSVLLTFFNTAVPFYVLYHPGLIYIASVDWPRYEQVEDTWNGIYLLIVANIALGIFNRANKLFLIAAILSMIYIFGLNLYPINYFHFTDSPVGHKVNTESLVYSIGLIGFNIYVLFKLLLQAVNGERK